MVDWWMVDWWIGEGSSTKRLDVWPQQYGAVGVDGGGDIRKRVQWWMVDVGLVEGVRQKGWMSSSWDDRKPQLRSVKGFFLLKYIFKSVFFTNVFFQGVFFKNVFFVSGFFERLDVKKLRGSPLMGGLGSGLSSVFLEVFSSEMYFSRQVYFQKYICQKWSSWEGRMMEGPSSGLSRNPNMLHWQIVIEPENRMMWCQRTPICQENLSKVPGIESTQGLKTILIIEWKTWRLSFQYPLQNKGCKYSLNWIRFQKK